MEVYLQPENDGLPVRDAGSWAKAKLDYLARYISVFETSMRQIWSIRHYIDLFAGPGKNCIRDSGEIVLGSPLLALTTSFPFTGCFFAELMPVNADALQRRCKASPHYNRVHTLTGDSNVVVNDIVSQIVRLDRECQQTGL